MSGKWNPRSGIATPSLRERDRKSGPACFSVQRDRCALRPFRENRNYTAISPLGKGMRRVTPANRERCLRAPGRKRRTTKSCGASVAEGAAVAEGAPSEGAACAAPSEGAASSEAAPSEGAACAAAPEYRNAAFSSHEDKDRAGQIRELLHCSVRFRAEQHRPPPSESFTTASSPILMAAAIVSPTTRFA